MKFQSTASFLGRLSVLMGLLAGCSPRDPGVYVAGGHGKYIKDMAAGDVIARVNGVEITKGNYVDLQNLREKIFRMFKGIPLSGRNEVAERYTYVNEQRLPDQLLQFELSRQYAKKNGIEAPTNRVEEMWRSLSLKLRRPRMTIDEVAEEIGGGAGGLLKENLLSDILKEEMVRHAATNDLSTVSEQSVSNRMAFVEIFNKNAIKCNTEAGDLLKKVRVELLGGRLDFQSAARKYSEVHPEDAKEWKTVELGELPDDRDGTKNPLKAWLEQAKVGDISNPLEMDDGISIVGLVAKFEGEAPKGYAKPINYQLVRCTRYFREVAPVLTAEETRRQLIKEQFEDAANAFGEKLFKEAVLEFPNGTNFYPTAEESFRWWQKEFGTRKF